MHCVNGTNVIAGRRKAGEKREAVVRPVTAARLSSGEDGAKEEDRMGSVEERRESSTPKAANSKQRQLVELRSHDEYYDKRPEKREHF